MTALLYIVCRAFFTFISSEICLDCSSQDAGLAPSQFAGGGFGINITSSQGLFPHPLNLPQSSCHNQQSSYLPISSVTSSLWNAGSRRAAIEALWLSTILQPWRSQHTVFINDRVAVLRQVLLRCMPGAQRGKASCLMVST